MHSPLIGPGAGSPGRARADRPAALPAWQLLLIAAACLGAVWLIAAPVLKQQGALIVAICLSFTLACGGPARLQALTLCLMQWHRPGGGLGAGGAAVPMPPLPAPPPLTACGISLGRRRTLNLAPARSSHRIHHHAGLEVAETLRTVLPGRVAGGVPPCPVQPPRLRVPWVPALTREEALRGLSYYGSGAAMQRVAAKLLAGQPISVVMLGGSITGGGGASSADLGYASRFFRFINESFPHG